MVFESRLVVFFTIDLEFVTFPRTLSNGLVDELLQDP